VAALAGVDTGTKGAGHTGDELDNGLGICADAEEVIEVVA
jgi:hypothetical protein